MKTLFIMGKYNLNYLISYEKRPKSPLIFVSFNYCAKLILRMLIFIIAVAVVYMYASVLTIACTYSYFKVQLTIIYL